MNVQLDPILEKFVNDQVRQGRFASPQQVLEAGVARLMLDAGHDELDAHDVAELRESLAQMRRGEVIDWKEYSARIRARYPR